MSKQSDVSPLLVRIPVPLKQWLSDRADANDRSMTAEILAMMKAVQRAEKQQAA